jgi:hypothetical protein
MFTAFGGKGHRSLQKHLLGWCAALRPLGNAHAIASLRHADDASTLSKKPDRNLTEGTEAGENLVTALDSKWDHAGPGRDHLSGLQRDAEL